MGSLEKGIPGLSRSLPPEMELTQSKMGFGIVGKSSDGLPVGCGGCRPGIGTQLVTLLQGRQRGLVSRRRRDHEEEGKEGDQERKAQY